ncbi:MAG: hypothetical protein ACXVD1_01145 [Nocardioides sp.]
MGSVVLAALLVSPHVGRAVPSGNYRPILPTDAIVGACFPLPEGLTLDFPYQVRSDGDVGRGAARHRRLVVQYDEIDAATARQRIGAALARAGLSPDAATVTAYPRIPSDSLVRGELVLRLPVVHRQRAAELRGDCLDPFSTKRFPRSWPPSNIYA